MKGTFLAIIAVALFMLFPIFAKILIKEMNPVLMLLVIEAAAAVFVVFGMGALHKLKHITKTKPKKFIKLFVISFFVAVLGPLLFVFGLMETSVINAVLLKKTEMFVMAMLAVFLLGDKISLKQIVGTFVAVIGVIIIAEVFVEGVIVPFGFGDLLVIGAGISMGVSHILFKKYCSDLHPDVVVAARNAFGAAMLLILSLLFFRDLGDPVTFSVPTLILILATTVMAVIAAQIFWYRALETTSAIRVSMAALSAPLFGIAYAVFLLGESITISQALGGAVIILGLILIEVHHWSVKDLQHRLKLLHWHH